MNQQPYVRKMCVVVEGKISAEKFQFHATSKERPHSLLGALFFLTLFVHDQFLLTQPSNHEGQHQRPYENISFLQYSQCTCMLVVLVPNEENLIMKEEGLNCFFSSVIQ